MMRGGSRNTQAPKRWGLWSFGLPLISELELERKFNHHFASKQISSDIFGTVLGAIVYLALLPSLAQLHRPGLLAAAVCCSALCLWPLLLSRWAREFYVRYRDFLLLAHFCFHYGIGGQLGRYVRIQQKIQPSGPAAFMASYVFSSTVFWQALDGLLYRMRFRKFLLLKPLSLLATLPLELRLCQQTCRDFPGDARHFHTAADALRLLTSPFRLVPVPLELQSTTPTDAAGAVISCSKVQAFLLVTLCWLMPAYLLHRLEKKMVWQHRQQCQALVVPNDELAALAQLAQQAQLAEQADHAQQVQQAQQATHAAAASTSVAASARQPAGLEGAAAAAAAAAGPAAAAPAAVGSAEGALGSDADADAGACAETSSQVEARGVELRQRWQAQRERQQDWRVQQDGETAEDLEPGWVLATRGLMVGALTWLMLDIVL